jgi:RNA polymerase sigma-70 factor (ECF subfamily)
VGAPLAAFLETLRAEGQDALAELLAARAPLADRVAAVCAAGAAAWPDLELPPEAFARHLARHAAAADDAEGYLATVHADDLYLACACAAHDPAALRALEAQHLAKVPLALARLRAGPERVDEVTQQLRERFLVGADGRPAIADYSGRGPLAGWVRVAAVRTFISLVRKGGPDRPGGDGTLLDLAAAGVEPDLELVRARYAIPFKAALTDALQALPRRERTLLRFTYVEGMTVDEIGAFYRTHRATAARWVARARATVLAETRRLLAERVACGESELQSVLRVVASQLDISIQRLLR